MMSKKFIARAEIPKREWLEFEIEVDSRGIIKQVKWQVFGCHRLIETAQTASHEFREKKVESLNWSGKAHWDLLLQEIILKFQEKFEIPVKDIELCHCRKIPTAVVDQAIVLGAHTPEKIRAWTTASSGCGTCRPDVEKMISSRIKVA